MPGGMVLRRPVTLTTGSLLLALPVILVVGFVIWGVAYNRGFNKGEQGVTKDLNLTPGTVNDPLKGTIPANPNLISDGGRSSGQPAPRGEVKNPVPAPQSGGARTPPAAITGDPRVLGLNYLILASRMDKESAERAAAFLTENGVPAFIVSVAKSGSAANNPGPYTLYAQQGITAEQYKARTPERTELEAKVARLGKVWQKEHRGQTDFSQTLWEKKKP